MLTDLGFANAVNAQQMLGGHGYIAEWGMEQFVRDARIPMIYEGANGIQALDLVGRKLPKDGGRALQAYFAEVQAFLNAHKDDAAMKPYIAPLGDRARPSAAGDHVVRAERDGEARQCRRRRHRLHASVRAGRARLMWVRIVKAANEKLASGAQRRTPSATSRSSITARFFMERMLPETGAHLARIQAGAESTMAMPIEGF